MVPLFVTIPRSMTLRAVLGCLRDHPHDDTPQRIAQRLGILTPDETQPALQALSDEGLAFHVGEHWQLTREGWKAARADGHSPDGRG
jgi:hypothetical protein